MKPAHLVILCALAASISIWASLRAVRSDDDFVGIYAAAQLAGTGHLFEVDRITHIETHYQPEPHPLPFLRLPIYAFMWKPLTWLPFSAARLLWALLNLSAMIAGVLLWPYGSKWAKAFVVCSYPFVDNLILGQDTAIFVLFAIVACRLLDKQRDRAAGCLLALCAIKFHLALLLPIALVAKRRWTAVFAAASGLVALLALSMAEGMDWPLREFRSIQGEHIGPAEMPTFFGFSVWFRGHELIEIILSFLLTALVGWIAMRSPTIWAAMAAALAGGLLVSHHAYLYDAVVLMPLLLLIHESGRGRRVAAILISPLLYIWRPTALAHPFLWPQIQFAILSSVIALLLYLETTRTRALDTVAVPLSTEAC
ncbi:MAG TPA: glycosyltransferase 87 family protein [Bryobacteraceae bacterium]|nr:glycosyltransferase 87 family protein [Bryobacteraceae bacterium]